MPALETLNLTNLAPSTVLSQIDAIGGEVKAFVDSTKSPDLGGGGGSQGAGFKFELLENPQSAFKILLGKNVDLFNWTTPTLHFEFSGTFLPVPIIVWPVPPIGLNLGGSFEADAQFSFGYDTQGFFDYSADNYQDPTKLFNGFYLGDWIGGTDVPELTLTFRIYAQAAVNLVLIEAGIRGGLIATVNLNLDEKPAPGEVADGKIRGHEIERALEHGPLCLVDVSGDLSFFLSVFIKFGISVFSARVRSRDRAASSCSTSRSTAAASATPTTSGS